MQFETSEPVTDYSVTQDVFAPRWINNGRWFVWAIDDGRKIPRAPWRDDKNGIESWASFKEPETWTDFETAKRWADHHPELHTANMLPELDPDDQRPVFFDFDDVRDPETGDVHPEAWEFIQGRERATLHGAVSSSGTGLHGFCLTDRVPADRKPSFTVPLGEWQHTDNPELEVYAADRFVGLTGDHIDQTPVELPNCTETIVEMFRELSEQPGADTEQRTPDAPTVDVTDDPQDVIDAVANVTPQDARLKSTPTNERADGSISFDPSFGSSESGTRLAWLGNVWVYRKGMQPLDTLQVVAAEERILTERDIERGEYPTGDDWWEAVGKLRDRGADIPEFDPRSDGERENPYLTELIAQVDDGKGALRTCLEIQADGDVPADAEPPDKVLLQAGKFVDLFTDDREQLGNHAGPARAVFDSLYPEDVPPGL